MPEQLAPVPPPRDLGVWKVPHRSYKELSQVQVHEGESLVSWDTDGGPLDAIVDNIGSDVTLATFHAAVSRPDHTVPYFMGWNLARGHANRISLSDPALIHDREMVLSWFAGSISTPATTTLTFLERLVHLMRGSRLVMFGASGGGFAALNFGRSFPGCTAVVANPQTDILQFHRHKWQQYAVRCWGADDSPASAAASIRENVGHDMTSLYAASRPEISVVYMQNDCDRHHVDRHQRPFLAANPDLDVELVGGDWGEGHKPPPRELLRNTILSALRGRDS